MEELLKYFKLIQKRWLPASLVFAVVFFFLGYERSKKTAPLYRATGTIIFAQRNDTPTDQVAITEQNKLNNDLVLIKSESFAEKVKQDLEFSLEIDNKKLAQNLVAVNPQNSDVIYLSFTDEDPQKATEIVNAWIKNYVQIDKDQTVSQSRDLAKFLETQISDTQKSLDSTAERLKDFKQKNRILDINTEAVSTISSINKLENEIATIQSELSAQKSHQDSLQKIFKVDSETALSSSFVNESPMVASLVKQIEEIKTKIEQEKLRFGDRHPQIISLQRQEIILQEQLKKYSENTGFQGATPPNQNDVSQAGTTQTNLIAEYAATERQIKSLEAKLKSLNELINTYKKRVDILPKLEFEHQKLQKELVTRDEILQNLIKNYQDTQIAINNTQGNIRSAEFASVPKNPIINLKLVYLIQGVMGGILAGSLVAYLSDKLDQRINNIDQIKEYFVQPIFAIIPDFLGDKTDKIKSSLPVRDNPSSSITENFTVLCDNIKFMDTKEKPLKIITISSLVSGEGKSTIAANMAIASAQLGRKVLLIEADFRKPRQNKIWQNINQSLGLSDLLQSENNLSSSEFVVSLMPDLDILLAGNTNSNPVALIGSPQMVYLLDEVKNKYDLIIIDTPAVSVAADAQILGRMSDGMLIVIRQGKANISILANTSESLLKADVNILGLLLNCFISNGGNYNYYNYSNSYDKKNQLFN
jgi:capsular exopolysaccharide synthesis family protein